MMVAQMFKRFFLPVFAALLLAGCSGSDVEQIIDGALIADHRTPTYVERDQFRHPKETLLFFGLDPEQSVVEVTPGFGWYAEILAPILRDSGADF